MTVTESVFTKTENGVRVKSWARPSGGYAKNLVFKNLVMRNVDNPVLIDQRYCPDNNCPRQVIFQHTILKLTSFFHVHTKISLLFGLIIYY